MHLVLAKDVEDIIANNNATMVTLSIMVTLPVYFLRRSKGQNQPFKKLRAYRCTGVPVYICFIHMLQMLSTGKL